MAGRTVAEFLERFMLPLVAGGEMAVGVPVSSAELQAFAEQLPHASPEAVAVDSARIAVLSDLVVRPPSLVLDVDELSLAAAVHNLLFVAHPRVDSFTVTASARARVIASAQRFASRPRSEDRSRVLARHALLHNLFDLRRTDVKVSWWTGSATFLGQDPPRRLLAWESLRRVRRDHTVTTFEQLLGGPDAAPVLGTLVRRTPLSQLLSRGGLGPPLHWEEAVFLVRDVELARSIAYAALSGAEPGQITAAPARFAAALEQMLERAPGQGDVRAVAAFLVHMNMLLAHREVCEGERSARSALLTAVLSPERAALRARGLVTFFALPNALAAAEPRLAQPPGLWESPDLAARWTHHRSQVAEFVGEAVIDTLAGRLRRHLAPMVESQATAHGPPAQHS